MFSPVESENKLNTTIIKNNAYTVSYVMAMFADNSLETHWKNGTLAGATTTTNNIKHSTHIPIHCLLWDTETFHFFLISINSMAIFHQSPFFLYVCILSFWMVLYYTLHTQSRIQQNVSTDKNFMKHIIVLGDLPFSIKFHKRAISSPRMPLCERKYGMFRES